MLTGSPLVEHLLRFALLGAEWVLWVLLFLFGISLYLIAERFFLYTLLRRRIRRIRGGERELLPALLLHPLDSLEGIPPPHRHRLIERFRRRLRRGLGFLGTLGANAPYIGLFGTVLGIIQAFHQLSQVSGGRGTQLVMIGISEALVATGVGLLVAIPCIFAYNFYLRTVQNLTEELEELLSSEDSSSLESLKE